MEFNKIRLGEVIQTNTSSYKKGDCWAFVNYLDTGNITENVVCEIQRIDLDKEPLPSRAKRKIQYNSIIYSTVRPNQRHYGIIKNIPQNFLVSTGFTVIDAIPEKIDADYLFYLLTQRDIIESLQAIAEQSVSTYPSISPSDIENLEVWLPELSEQKKIAAILSALDEKIAINRAINENLQQQARALYKSWFVDFEPFDKRMPDLWKIGKLKDVLCLRKEVLKAGERTDLCYLPIDTIPMNTFALTSTRPNEEAQSSLLAFYRDDIIIGAMRVYFHRVIIAPFDGITRSTCFVLTPKDPNYLAFGLLCCDQDKSIDFAQQSSKGSTMPYAVWDGGLGELEIAIPPQDIASEFNTIIMPMIREIQKSYYETGILSNIRDTLSPKLMSGEIDVSAILF